eukprot:SAG31_NODE_643_length_13291_cov_6.294042_11_plen_41_part_00
MEDFKPSLDLEFCIDFTKLYSEYTMKLMNTLDHSECVVLH